VEDDKQEEQECDAATVCVALLWCDTETVLCRKSHIAALNTQLAAVLLHHSIPATLIDSTAAVTARSTADSLVAAAWSIMIPMFPEEFGSLSDVQVAIREQQHGTSIAVSPLKDGCIVISGHTLHTLLKVTV
jgi:hypothetical protein